MPHTPVYNEPSILSVSRYGFGLVQHLNHSVRNRLERFSERRHIALSSKEPAQPSFHVPAARSSRALAQQSFQVLEARSTYFAPAPADTLPPDILGQRAGPPRVLRPLSLRFGIMDPARLRPRRRLRVVNLDVSRTDREFLSSRRASANVTPQELEEWSNRIARKRESSKKPVCPECTVPLNEQGGGARGAVVGVCSTCRRFVSRPITALAEPAPRLLDDWWITRQSKRTANDVDRASPSIPISMRRSNAVQARHDAGQAQDNFQAATPNHSAYTLPLQRHHTPIYNVSVRSHVGTISDLLQRADDLREKTSVLHNEAKDIYNDAQKTLLSNAEQASQDEKSCSPPDSAGDADMNASNGSHQTVSVRARTLASYFSQYLDAW